MTQEWRTDSRGQGWMEPLRSVRATVVPQHSERLPWVLDLGSWWSCWSRLWWQGFFFHFLGKDIVVIYQVCFWHHSMKRVSTCTPSPVFSGLTGGDLEKGWGNCGLQTTQTHYVFFYSPWSMNGFYMFEWKKKSKEEYCFMMHKNYLTFKF